MSPKSVTEKLYLKPGKSVMFFNPPENNEALLGGLSKDIIISTGDPADILLAYIEDEEQLHRNLIMLKNNIKDDGALWIAYHKQSSSVDTNINRDSIHTYATQHGLKGVGMISINDDWSAFRFKIID